MEVNLRAVVLDILEEIESNNEFSHIIINNALLKYQYLDKSKRSFINKLSLGIIESQIELDYIINKYSKTPVKKMKPVIRRIVRMGVYQIIYMDNENIYDAAYKEAHTIEYVETKNNFEEEPKKKNKKGKRLAFLLHVHPLT